MKNKRLQAVIASVVIHLIIAAIAGMYLSEHYLGLNDDAIDVRFIKNTSTRDTVHRTHRTVAFPRTQQTADPLRIHIPPTNQIPKVDISIQDTTATPTFETDVLNPTDVSVPSLRAEAQQRVVNTVKSTPVGVPTVPSTAAKTKLRSPVVISPKSNTPKTDTFTELLDDTLPEGGLKGRSLNVTLQNPVLLPQGQLGAILQGTNDNLRGHIRIIRLKHSLSDWWQDPTALPALMEWMDKHTTIRLDMNFEGGALSLTNPKIFDAPLLVMTGHDKDITVGRGLAKEGPLQSRFTPEERAALRKYIVDEGGMLFFDDCGFHGLFAHIVAEELEQIFPDYPLEILPHEHEIYTIHYHLSKPPTGGDVFWGNENNAQPTQFRFQKGIIIDNRLAVIYNRKDYMCAMETAEIESRTMLRLRHSPDVYRFMTNLLIYALKYGGNTDRSGYKE